MQGTGRLRWAHTGLGQEGTGRDTGWTLLSCQRQRCPLLMAGTAPSISCQDGGLALCVPYLPVVNVCRCLGTAEPDGNVQVHLKPAQSEIRLS